MVTGILKDMGLMASRHNPCLFSGTTNDDSAPETIRTPVYVGLYVDDFVFFSESGAEEDRFQQLLSDRLKVDFMGEADFFLGPTFEWNRKSDGGISVMIHQQAFTEHLGTRFGLATANRTVLMTPYRSGYPIDAVVPPDPDDPNQNSDS